MPRSQSAQPQTGAAGQGLTGGCACGQARYRITEEPVFVNICHCSLCQRQSGSAFAYTLFVESKHVELMSGVLSDHLVPSGSGGGQTIRRCHMCGTALWSHYAFIGDGCSVVRVGTLDRPDQIKPDAVCYVSAAAPWVVMDAGIPHFDRQPDVARCLQPDKVTRFRAMFNKENRG